VEETRILKRREEDTGRHTSEREDVGQDSMVEVDDR
jgi:hypothetical protein